MCQQLDYNKWFNEEELTQLPKLIDKYFLLSRLQYWSKSHHNDVYSELDIYLCKNCQIDLFQMYLFLLSASGSSLTSFVCYSSISFVPFIAFLLQSSFKTNCTIRFDSSSICWCFMLCIILQFFTWSLFSFNSSDYLIIGTKLSLYFISISFNKETEKRVNDKYCKIRSYYVVWWCILHCNKSLLNMFHQV